MFEKRSKIYLYVMYYNQIVSFWLENITCEWYLRVTEDIQPNNATVVSYLIRAGTNGKTWVFPDEAQLEETEAEQIFM